MRDGDIEVRVRGGTRFAELSDEQLADFVVAMTKLLKARLVGVKPTCFTFRRKARKSEAICDSNI